MDHTTRTGRGAVRGTLLAASLFFAAASVQAQAPTTINSVKTTAAGERTDRMIIEYSGRDPELATQTIDGSLVVTLKGARLAGSVPANQSADASLNVVQSIQAATQGDMVELNVQAKAATWSFSATQSRKRILIVFVASAMQPERAAAVAVPLPAAPVGAAAAVGAAAVAAGSSALRAAPAPAAASAAAPTVAVAGEQAADATPRRRDRPKDCIECHEGFYSITKTKHYVRSDSRTPGSKGAENSAAECEACHGDLTAHQKTPRVKGLVPITFGKKAPAEPQNEQCLTCHQGGTRIHWQGSGHDRAKQTCSGCHRLHAPKDPVMVVETQASVCFDCHKDRRAEMQRISTHPTKSGFITCSSCHASHGSNTRASLQKPSVNQTCYQCHAEKRGPFLWEHRSAQDDCTNCHNPHGTNIAPMLKVRQPFLCQQCHMSAGHPSTLFTGADAVPGSSGNQHRILGKACTNCHVKVHGTNHPSGARLQR